MSRLRMALAAAAIALVGLAALPSAPAEAGIRLRIGGPFGIMRSAMGRILGIARGHRGHRHARHGLSRSRTAALPAQVARSAIDPDRPLSSPLLRAQLASVAALAAWHGGRSENGWWRHADGNFGWVGPLFWPFADDDLADYVMFGRGAGLLSYGYGDIYAAVFSPYTTSELAAYADERRRRKIPALDQFCGTAPGEKSALPVERIKEAISPNEAQAAALDELASAWGSSAQIIRAHCQTAPAASGLQRLEAMQGRIAAMIEAAGAIEPQLAKFDDLLDAGQKQKLAALAKDSRPAPSTERPPAQTVGAVRAAPAPAPACLAVSPDALIADPKAEQQAREQMARQWPLKDIAARLKLDDTQSAALEVLQDTTQHVLDPRDSGCPPPGLDTMPDRLEAARDRLNALLVTVKATRSALDDFYYGLNDEQKAQFEALGQGRTM